VLAFLCLILGRGSAVASTLAQAIGSWEYDQIEPAAAYNTSAGEYLVVWEDHHWGYGANWDIYGRRVAADGTPLGDKLGISWDTWGPADNQRLAPDVAYNSTNNEYLVVLEYAYSASDHDILARRVAANGTPIGSDVAIAGTSPSQTRPAVAYVPATNSYLVVYEELVGSDEMAYKSVRGVLVSAAGVPGAPFAISTGTLGAAAPDVAYGEAAGQYLVVWQDRRVFPTGYEILGQRVTAGGALTGSPVLVGSWDYDQVLPTVAYNPDAIEYLVVWEDHHWGVAAGWDICGQRVAADGSLRGGFLTVANYPTKHMTRPDVAYNAATRNYLVVWDYVYSETDHDVYARRVAYDGMQPDAEVAISYSGYQERAPAVAAGSGNTALLVWEDGRNTSLGLDIYGEPYTITLPALCGGVYEGSIGDISTPLPDVTVGLYCSNDAGSMGAYIGGSTTSRSGAYCLPVPGLCEYYNLQETDPADYTSVGATSVSGTVKNSNWIQYAHPLAGKTWSGNAFWDAPVGPVDSLPPGNWTAYSPAGWVNVRDVPVSVHVEDTQSGLNPASAEFAYWMVSRGDWSDWEPASCTGAPGATGPQTLSALAPFETDGGAAGPNRVRFRIADMAGNLGNGPEYIVKIDTVAPSNPTELSSPTHAVNTWTQATSAMTAWSGASDDRSGISGYAYTWDHAPATVPDGWDTSDTSVTGYPLSDAGDWYFHVRAYDAAGNAAAGAVHLGPIKVDTGAPTAWLTAPASGASNTLTLTVSWAGGDVLSGVASYDVQTSPDGATWSTWKDDITATSAEYTGTRGATIRFRVQARDRAGNLSPWSSTAQVTFGVPVTVRVRNELGNLLNGAQVYHQGSLAGVTNASGTYAIPYALLDDQLVARHMVAERTAAKPGHGWMYRVYQTSVPIANDGTPQIHAISNTGTAYQDLTVRRNQAAIGFRINVWVEWDASPAFLAGLSEGLRGASAYLYDVTDGQLFWEQIEVWDDGQNGPAGDLNVYTVTWLRPNAFVGSIDSATFGRMYLPRSWGAAPWSTRAAWGVMIHEFGHYGLYLGDEYASRDGTRKAFCTYNRGVGMDDEPTRASIMDNTDNASEMCSDADPLHAHNTDTDQDLQNPDETTWETVMRKYSDIVVPARWILQSPDTRMVPVVAGPTALPVSAWVSVAVHDYDTGVCAPFTRTVAVTATGQPAVRAEVTLDRPVRPDMFEGFTDDTGAISILGAHPGDVLRAKLGNLSGAWTVSCTPGGAAALETTESVGIGAVEAAAAIGLTVDPYDVALEVVPLGPASVQVRVQASVALSAAPAVTVWQTGASDPIAVTMAYGGTPGLYTGVAGLVANLDPQGLAQVSATSGSATVWSQRAFSIQPVDAEHNGTHVTSADGMFDLLLPAGALAADALVAVQAAMPGPGGAGLVPAGQAYLALASTGQIQLNLSAVANVRYPDPLPAGMAPGELRLYSWSDLESRWLPLGPARLDEEHRIVSTDVDALGTYALMAGSEPGWHTYLPLVMR
jgi:hypothetical protein